MAIAAPPAPESAPPARPERRDAGIDLVRAACLVLVVVLHALMVGVSMTASGPVFENAAEGTDWFVPVSWFAQMMPLFFIVGGFSSITAYRRSTLGAAHFIATRVRRLLVPSAVAVGAVGAGLAALLAAGVPSEIVAVAGFRISQPLWFLGVYLLCQLAAPAMVRAHERNRVLTLVVLVAGVIGVDAATAAAGIPFLGFVNLAFVWLLMQQLGFWLAHGRLARVSRSARLLLALGSLGALSAVTGVGLYSPDMYVNLNPPTVALALLGVAQLAALSLAQPLLRRLATRAPVAAVVGFIGARSMTIYLWHMPALIALAELSVLAAPALGLPLPPPGSVEWWATRPLWIATALAATAALARVAGRIESASQPAAAPSIVAAIAAAALGIASVVVLMIDGVTVPTAAASALLMITALHLAGSRPTPALTGARTPAGHSNPTGGGPRRHLRVMSPVPPRP